MIHHYREPEDLLADESFLDWHFDMGRETDAAWENWLENDPSRQQLVDAAIALFHTTYIREKAVQPGQLKKAEEQLLQRITEKDRTIHTAWNWRWIAAACVIAVAAGVFFLRTAHPAKAQLTTAYGQIAQQSLPDGTEVTLNANSRLHYSTGWREGVDREVWIEGEAFFHVRRTPEKSRFIVHTDHFDIIVTGTRFNVVNRPDRTNILLREGSVILQQQNDKELSMAPGDFVEWGRDHLKMRPATADSVLAWKDQKLVLDRTPLRDLIGIIKDQYGVNVSLGDSGIADSTVSGIIPNGNLDILLRALEATSDFDVKKEDSGVTIRAHAR
jgi:ferric-dicitrate binding protein FerR (iron transport regulator)